MDQINKGIEIVEKGKEKVEETVKKVYKRILKAIRTPEMTILPGNIAYFFFMSVIPMITLFGLMGAMLPVDIDDVLSTMRDILPKDVYNIIVPFFTNSKWSLGISFTTFLAFFLASNAPYSIIVASNTLYKFENVSEIKRRIKALLMTFVLYILMFFIIIVLAFGDSILNLILNLKVFDGMTQNTVIIVSLIKWPTSIFLIYLMIKLVYAMAPDKRIPSKYVEKGALFTTVLWITATWIFSFYTNYVANYDMFYGSLSGIIVLLLYIYILAYIMVVGIAINTSYYIEFEKK